MIEDPLDSIPMWAVFLGTVAIIWLAIETGYRVGYRRHREVDREAAPVRTICGAILALLAFILAFTFGTAAARFDARKTLVVREANAIATAYLRADLLPNASAPEARRSLREYVELRVAGIEPGEVQAAISRSEELHAALWEQAMDIAREAPDSVGERLFISALNAVFDLHRERTFEVVHNRIPASVWAVLYLVMAVAMAAVGYHSGLIGTRRLFVTTALSLSFSLVLVMIVDLDRPQSGLLRVSQQAMTDLRESMD